jgi:hypothetical protein
VQARDTTGPGALVIFDGSTVGMPVKVFGNAPCQPGDRVALTLYGSDWVVTSGYNALGYGEANKSTTPTGATGALTSGTFVDLTEIAPITGFTKFYDATFVRVGMKASSYVSVAGTVAQFAVRFTATEGGAGWTPVDHNMNRLYFNQINTHTPDTHAIRILGIPAGTYTVSTRWRRAAARATSNVTPMTSSFSNWTSAYARASRSCRRRTWEP